MSRDRVDNQARDRNRELFRALEKEDLDLFRAALESGADPNAQGDGSAVPKEMSILFSSLEHPSAFLRLLLQHNADVNRPNSRSGQHVVAEAATKGLASHLVLLLAHRETDGNHSTVTKLKKMTEDEPLGATSQQSAVFNCLAMLRDEPIKSAAIDLYNEVHSCLEQLETLANHKNGHFISLGVSRSPSEGDTERQRCSFFFDVKGRFATEVAGFLAHTIASSSYKDGETDLSVALSHIIIGGNAQGVRITCYCKKRDAASTIVQGVRAATEWAMGRQNEKYGSNRFKTKDFAFWLEEAAILGKGIRNTRVFPLIAPDGRLGAATSNSDLIRRSRRRGIQSQSIDSFVPFPPNESQEGGAPVVLFGEGLEALLCDQKLSAERDR